MAGSAPNRDGHPLRATPRDSRRKQTSEATKTSIVERIKETTMETDTPVTLDTELYEDLRIWGADFYELIAWIAETFGTDFSTMDASKYAPGEGAGEFGFVRLFSGRSPYRKCTVAQLLAAVDRGRWED
jgi:hypothetical protein